MTGLPRSAGFSCCSHDAKGVEIEEQPLDGICCRWRVHLLFYTAIRRK
jgi:hypothetical protein